MCPGKGTKEYTNSLTEPIINLTLAIIKSMNMKAIIIFHSSPSGTMMKKEVCILWVRAHRIDTLTYCA